MAKMTDTAAQAAIGAATRELHLPTVRTECVRLAETAERSQATYLGYLAEMLAADVDDRTERRKTPNWTRSRRGSNSRGGSPASSYRRENVMCVMPLGLLTTSIAKRSSSPSRPSHSRTPRPRTIGAITMCMWSIRSAARN